MRRSERGRRRRAREGRNRDRGFVTAEAAVVLPTLALFAMALVWTLLAACAQIQCVDAARAGARAAARQDPEAVVVAAARQAAPRGARVSVRRDGDLVRVEVVADAPGPGVLGLGLRLRSEAVALAEEAVASAEETVASVEEATVAAVEGTAGVGL
ncbi:TadE family type IV pilus minor pilin [Streptomyces huasconensis]|uniref:TadE family type IV pilus minor pilin n=1 Tax=Streptomyces huasconensis TaxID=1854574 RepID=UPI0033E248C5